MSGGVTADSLKSVLRDDPQSGVLTLYVRSAMELCYSMGVSAGRQQAAEIAAGVELGPGNSMGYTPTPAVRAKLEWLRAEIVQRIREEGC